MSYEETTEPNLIVSLGIDGLTGITPAAGGLVAYLRSRGLHQAMNDFTVKWIDKTLRRTRREFLESREWDAFGHCWVACEAARLCGESNAANAGLVHELGREIGIGGPHDSLAQDLRNQALGRRLSHQVGKSSALCDQAYRNHLFDLSAPLTRWRWSLARGQYHL